LMAAFLQMIDLADEGDIEVGEEREIGGKPIKLRI
jgi:hypothetical protein